MALRKICSRLIMVVFVILIILFVRHFIFSKTDPFAEVPHLNIYQNLAQNPFNKIVEYEKAMPALDNLRNDDPKLIDIIRKDWLELPSLEPYNFTHPEKVKNSMFEQDLFVDGLFNHMQHGFFIEAGAVDGEVASNSLFFEMNRKWTGLLVEPDPIAYSQLKTKKRNAYSINSCLDSIASQAVFNVMWRHGHIDQGNLTKKSLVHDYPIHKRRVQCFSIYSLLLALNRTRVDYFSLDVESVEPQVLRAIPFDKIDIQVLCVEFIHCGKQVLFDILGPAGYVPVKELGFDLIFVKKSKN